MWKEAAAGLTISAVSARTGVRQSTLRAWEHRHGFPEPQRLPGGHRRYSEAEVTRILRVVAERSAGRTLEAAIEVARRDHTTDSDPTSFTDTDDRSIFAGLRRSRPDLHAVVLGRRTMLALSRAIEDESVAQADRPHLVAAFQTARAYAVARARWDDLLVTAGSAIVLADFPRSSRRGRTAQVSIPAGDPMRREWSVVCDGRRSAALLAGWERPDGRFEAIWAVDAHAVRFAHQLGRRLAERHAPRLRLMPMALPPIDDDQGAALRRSEALTTRAMSYLEG